MAEAAPIGIATDRVIGRIAAISGFRSLLQQCPTPGKRRALIASAHENGAIDELERRFLTAEAA